MKVHRIGRFLGFIAALPLACLTLASCKSASYGSAASGAEKAGPAGPATPSKLVSEYDALASQILEGRKKEVEIVGSILKAAHADAVVALGNARGAIKSGDRKAAQASLEDLAADVGFLGTEGDGACARVRKRLVEGGHHYNPSGGGAADSAHGTAQPGHNPAQPGHTAQPGQPAHNAAQPAPGQGHAKGETPPAGEGAHHTKQGPEHHAHTGGANGFDLGYVVVSRSAKKTFIEASQAIAKLSTAPDAAALDQEWAKVETAWAGLWKAPK